MKTRIFSAFLMILVLVFLALINNTFLNLAVLTVLFAIGFYEASKLFKAQNASLVAGLCVYLYSSCSFSPLIMGACLIILVLGYLAFYAKDIRLILPFLYPLLPMLSLWQLLDSEGMSAFIWLLVIVGFTDSMAYFIGKACGRTSFCKTSPNKTLEGLLGGVVCAVIIGSIYGSIWMDLDLLNIVFISLFVSIFAILGDLIESYFKRLAGVKDSGDIIPGHGGILDRLDAVMMASFAMLVLL